MICPNCNKEIKNDSTSCPECGYNLKINESKKKINIKIFMLLFILIAVCCLGAVTINRRMQVSKLLESYNVLLSDSNYQAAAELYNNTENKSFKNKANDIAQQIYENATQEKDEDKEIGIFNSGLLGEGYILSLEQKIIDEINKLKEDFINEKVEFTEIRVTLDRYSEYENSNISLVAKETWKCIDKLNDSRYAFKVAIESENAADYEKALENYMQVIPEDKNYNQVQNKINEIIPLYKNSVFATVDEDMESDLYETAIERLEKLEEYCADEDVALKISTVKTRQIESYKNKQQVEVLSTNVYNEGNYVTIMKAQVTVRNNSNKVAKAVSFGLLLFDRNGYPVDVKYKIYEGTYSNEFNCEFSSCNIIPGKTYGQNWAFSVPEQCKKAKACVKQVEFIDGTIWNNPYYSYWLKDNFASL